MLPDSRIYRYIAMVGVLVSAVTAAEAGTVLESLRERTSWLTGAVAPVYVNPAARPALYSHSLTNLGIAAEGGTDRQARVWAGTFRHMGASTVWGDASYTLGKMDDHGAMRASVTPDASAAPYLPATERGGRYTSERYAFTGGYALTKGRWSFGAAVSYDAWLSYRSRDPRPRNVSGTLTLTGGVVRQLTPHRFVGVYGGYVRYTQTSSVMFANPQGAEPIYHLTGLGSRYGRFDGQGWKTTDGSHGFMVGLSSYPAQTGWVASAELQTGNLTTILADINNLPLGRLRRLATALRGGYRGRLWYAGLHGYRDRSTGTENIFGDPMASVYPVIASREAWSSRGFMTGASGVVQTGMFTFAAGVDYRYVAQRHYEDSRSLDLEVLEVRGGLQWQRRVGRCLVTAEGTAGCHVPLSGVLRLPQTDEVTDPAGARLTREVRDEFDYDHSGHLYGSLGAWVAVPVANTALVGGVSARRSRYNNLKIYLSVCF